MHSCMSPAGRLKNHQRGFGIETLVLRPGDLLSKSSNFFQKKVVGGQSPANDRRVGGKHNTEKQADSGLGGVDAQEFPGAIPEADHVLAFCQASFRMTLSRAGFLTLAPGKKYNSFIKNTSTCIKMIVKSKSSEHKIKKYI